MFLRRYAIAALGAALVTSSGCGPSAVKRACMGGSGGGNALVDGAAMMRLDVYDPSVACVDGVLPDGAGSPVLSHSYVAGQAISLDVPPGAHTLVLTTFADEAGTMALGQACTTETLQAGSQVCFDLTVLPAPIGDDLSVVSCTVTPNSCPAGYYCDGTSCQNGCASDQDCANGPDGGASIATHCDPVSHGCVECVTTSDCGPSQICTAGHCIANCTSTQKLCNGVCIPQASCCMNSDCTMPPAPAACYAGTCTTTTGSCSYAKKNGAVVCGSTCCNAINGTCNGTCGLTCNSGYADCNGDPSDGCETNLGAAGKKLCNGMCIAATSCCSSSDCTTPPPPMTCYNATGTCSAPGGTCSYTQITGSQICNAGTTCCDPVNGSCSATCGLTCSTGYLDCNMNVSDGCETACSPANGTGKCAVGGGCGIASCNSGFHDCNGSASDGCECGTSCCMNPITSMQDCLVNTHNDGWGHTFSACYPLGVPGANPAPGTGYSVRVAQDAAAVDTSVTGNCTVDTDCSKVFSAATCVNGACIWPTAQCIYTGNQFVQSLCRFTIGSQGTKPSVCTCWAYGATTGTCNGAPCESYIGHTFNQTANFCGCTSPSDPTYQ